MVSHPLLSFNFLRLYLNTSNIEYDLLILFPTVLRGEKKQRAEKRASKTRPDPSEVLGNLCNPSSRGALEQIPELSSSTARCSGFCLSGQGNYGQGKHAKAIIQIWPLPQRSGLSSVSVFLSLVAGVFYLLQFPPLLFLLIMHQTSQLWALGPQLSANIQKACESDFAPPVLKPLASEVRLRSRSLNLPFAFCRSHKWNRSSAVCA